MRLAFDLNEVFVSLVDDDKVEVWVFVEDWEETTGDDDRAEGIGGDDNEAVEIDCADIDYIELGGWEDNVRIRVREK